MTSWAQPKLTLSIYVTARDDRAKVAYNFFFFFESANSVSLVKEGGSGVLLVLFYDYATFRHRLFCLSYHLNVWLKAFFFFFKELFPVAH